MTRFQMVSRSQKRGPEMGITRLDSAVEGLDLFPQPGDVWRLVVALDDGRATRDDGADSVLLYCIEYLAWNMRSGFVLGFP